MHARSTSHDGDGSFGLHDGGSGSGTGTSICDKGREEAKSSNINKNVRKHRSSTARTRERLRSLTNGKVKSFHTAQPSPAAVVSLEQISSAFGAASSSATAVANTANLSNTGKEAEAFTSSSVGSTAGGSASSSSTCASTASTSSGFAAQQPSSSSSTSAATELDDEGNKDNAPTLPSSPRSVFARALENSSSSTNSNKPRGVRQNRGGSRDRNRSQSAEGVLLAVQSKHQEALVAMKHSSSTHARQQSNSNGSGSSGSPHSRELGKLRESAAEGVAAQCGITLLAFPTFASPDAAGTSSALSTYNRPNEQQPPESVQLGHAQLHRSKTAALVGGGKGEPPPLSGAPPLTVPLLGSSARQQHQEQQQYAYAPSTQEPRARIESLRDLVGQRPQSDGRGAAASTSSGHQHHSSLGRVSASSIMRNNNTINNAAPSNVQPRRLHPSLQNSLGAIGLNLTFTKNSSAGATAGSGKAGFSSPGAGAGQQQAPISPPKSTNGASSADTQGRSSDGMLRSAHSFAESQLNNNRDDSRARASQHQERMHRSSLRGVGGVAHAASSPAADGLPSSAGGIRPPTRPSARPSTSANIGAGALEAKVVILGSQGVGKTSIVHRYTTGQFSAASMPSTIGASFLTKRLIVSGTKIRLQIWDTAGQERFRSMAPMYYRGSHAAIIVYDITNRKSLVDLRSWIEELRKNMGDDLTIHIVGAKNDLEQHREVTLEEARQLIESWSAFMSPVLAEDGVAATHPRHQLIPQVKVTPPTRTNSRISHFANPLSVSRFGFPSSPSQARDSLRGAQAGIVSSEDDPQLAAERVFWHNIKVSEVSAKENAAGIEDVFYRITKELVERKEAIERERAGRESDSIILATDSVNATGPNSSASNASGWSCCSS